MKTLGYIQPLFLALALGAGCATHAGRSSTALSKPVKESEFRLFEKGVPNDILVVYDEYYSPRGPTKKRAYFLFKNQPRVADFRKPEFISTNQMRGLEEIPVFTEVLANNPQFQRLVITETNRVAFHYAVVFSNRVDFALYQGPIETGRYHLPVYHHELMDRFSTRAMLITREAAYDAGVAGVVAFYAGIYWLAAGAPGLAHH